MFKHQKDHIRFFYLHPLAAMIAVEMFQYCHDKGQPFLITSTVSTLKEDQEINRRSSTHRSGRAFDLRTTHWDDNFLSEFMTHFNRKYQYVYGAQSFEGQHKFLVYHVGTAPHLHVQIHRRFERNPKLPDDV